MRILKQPFRHVLVFLLGAVALSGCASPAEMQNMVVARQAAVSNLPTSPFRSALIIARADGGETTNPLWTSEVDNTAFRGALQASLEQNDLLADPPASSRFDLFATLASMNQPLFGLDLSVGSNILYRVVERKTRLTWFDETVYASYTATFSDSPLAIQRLRFANEGSIRENIKEFIKRLVATRPPTGVKPDTPPLEERLQSLRKLLDDGLINQEEFDRKQRQILENL
jgi:hypothetical protein